LTDSSTPGTSIDPRRARGRTPAAGAWLPAGAGPRAPRPATRARDPARFPAGWPTERAPRRPAQRGRRLVRLACCGPRAAACGSACGAGGPPRGP